MLQIRCLLVTITFNRAEKKTLYFVVNTYYKNMQKISIDKVFKVTLQEFNC